MMKKIFIIIILLTKLSSFGQNNPVLNLNWNYSHTLFDDYFQLLWEEPEQPHDELIGFNIYRDNDLYRFQTDIGLYKTIEGFDNCDSSFLIYDNGSGSVSGFDIHVTAVYNGGIESDYIETVYCYGMALHNNDFKLKKAILYPNPTNGVLYVNKGNLSDISVYDVSGKILKQFANSSQINLSGLSKGLYILKLHSENEIIFEKILLE